MSEFKKIGVIGALEKEVSSITDKMTEVAGEKVGGVDFYRGEYEGVKIVICCVGMGKAAAAAGTQLLCTHFGCDAVIFSGIAGNMSGRVGINDIVLGKYVYYHDAQTDMLAQSYPNLERYTADERLLLAADKVCKSLGINYIQGEIATGDLFIGSDALKADIRSRCNPDCVEMEGAAVSHIAAKNDVPCLIIRSISDNADDEAGETLGNAQAEFDITEFCKTSARILLGVVGSFI